MLPRRWAFVVENKTGVASGQITILGRTWKIDPSSGLVYNTETVVLSTTGLANGGFFTGDIQENGTELDYGGHFTFQGLTGPGADGDMIVYFNMFSDAGTVSPQPPSNGFPVAALSLGPSDNQTTQIEV